MAAVLPFLETEQYSFPAEVSDASLAGLSGGKKKELTAEQMIAVSNTEQTRLVWTRTLIQQVLAQRTFSLAASGNKIKITLSEAFPYDTIPWANTSQSIRSTDLFTTNSKMRCPTFDLPAGAPEIGGSCPGASPAQTPAIGRGVPAAQSNLLEERNGRLTLRLFPSVAYELSRSICAACYATGGRYGDPTVQISEVLRFAVVRAAVENARMKEAFMQAVLWQIPRLPYSKLLAKGEKGDDEMKAELVTRMEQNYPKVVRIHSSGDFFSVAYAKMWLEIARRLYDQHGMEYRLWAPTRTHVVPGFANSVWKAVDIPPNFSVRPSAYHIGDPAPIVPGMAKGTSVLNEADSERFRGEFFDHQCGVYDLGKGNKTCVNAKAPDGTVGCRACWVQPDLRVNYVAH